MTTNSEIVKNAISLGHKILIKDGAYSIHFKGVSVKGAAYATDAQALALAEKLDASAAVGMNEFKRARVDSEKERRLSAAYPVAKRALLREVVLEALITDSDPTNWPADAIAARATLKAVSAYDAALSASAVVIKGNDIVPDNFADDKFWPDAPTAI